MVVMILLFLPVPANSKENKIESLEYSIAQCENGRDSYCRRVGELASIAAFETKNYKSEIKLLDIACNFGSVPSCETLGAAYDVGMEGQMRLCEIFPNSDTYCERNSLIANTRQNKKLAVKYYNLACLGGNSPDSCFYLYLWFKDGKGVPKSSKKAKQYLNKACEDFTFTACT